MASWSAWPKRLRERTWIAFLERSKNPPMPPYALARSVSVFGASEMWR
jgi:hypothetical protein